MTTTTYLRLQKPPFDTIPWDDAINGNMDILDAFIRQFMSIPNFTGIWANATNYTAGQNTLDATTGVIYVATSTQVSSASPTTFAQERAIYPTLWQHVDLAGVEYAAEAAASATAAAASVVNSADQASASAASAVAAHNSELAAATSSIIAQNNVGRNLIHNGMFRVYQRGAGPFTTSAYIADRWLQTFINGSVSTTIGDLSDADRTTIGDEGVGNCLVSVVVGGAAAGDYAFIEQRTENVYRLAGKTLTLSFWARAASGTPKIGCNFLQSFGSGGGPSAAVVLVSGLPVILSTTWTRYSVQLPVPSTSGKTLGSTAGSSYFAVRFWLSSGATFNAQAGSIGVQSATFYLCGVQLEVGTAPTPLEKLSFAHELANCQRFYLTGLFEVAGYGLAANGVAAMHLFPTTMRAVPTVASSSVNETNCSGALANLWEGGLSPYATATVNGGVVYNGHFTASADL